MSKRAQRSRRLLACLALAGTAALVTALALPDSSASAASSRLPEGRAIVASGTISPRTHFFGDTVRAVVSVTIDRRRVEPDGVR
ncbi:MAG: hypothetical protein M3M94_01455, partial [Actinomycetota bacterium]|nr:hypothetical protein [Actinomycetota bacterium]